MTVGSQEYRQIDHWFSYDDCCLAVSELRPCHEGPAKNPRHMLVFLHGRFGHGEIWMPLVRRLAAHFQCLHLDLPGFGRSLSARGRGHSIQEQSRMIRHVVARFLPRGLQAVLVGHDIGGVIAQLCAIHEPTHTGAMVLINSSMLTSPPRLLRAGWQGLRARRNLMKLFGSSGGAASTLSPASRGMIYEVWLDRTKRRHLGEAFRAWEATWPGPFERNSWKQKMRGFSRPVLLLWSRADWLNPVEYAEELLRIYPDAYLFENESCGHWPCLESTDWVEGKLREFLFRLHDRGAHDASWFDSGPTVRRQA
jgi:pimeloyl-ACP methyl ester carboxylesterase